MRYSPTGIALVLVVAIPGAWLLAVPGSGRTAPAANLVVNGSFDRDLAGWMYAGAPSGTPWQPSLEGRLGVAGHANVNDYDYENHSYVQQCIRLDAAVPGRLYSLEASMYAPPGQERLLRLFVDVDANSGVDCYGDWLPRPEGPRLHVQDTQPGAWVDARAGPASLAPGVRSIRVTLGVGKTKPTQGSDPASPVVGYFDDIVVAPVTSIAVRTIAGLARQ